MNAALSDLIDEVTQTKNFNLNSIKKNPEKGKVVRKAIAKIAEDYASSPEISQSYYDKFFGAGYKAGYTDMADENYTRAMFNMWKKHVADSTEKTAQFAGDRLCSKLEIVEPEVICSDCR